MPLATNGHFDAVERFRQVTLPVAGTSYELDLPGDAMFLFLQGDEDAFFAHQDGGTLTAANARRVRLETRGEDYVWLGGAPLGSETPARRDRVRAYLAGTEADQVLTVGAYR